MDHTPATPKPQRRWKRWVVIGAILVLGCWWYFAEAPEVAAAKSVAIGMTKAEVYAVIGPDPIVMGAKMTYAGPQHSGIMRGESYSRWHMRILLAQQKLGFRLFETEPDNWPVNIRFDNRGRADRIKRGREIVEQ